ncbi:MAG: hypothetical protein K8T91_12075 [Planctomycetes bacterium]|nr:hypothetical protein [Planctomycetota bacterium]
MQSTRSCALLFLVLALGGAMDAPLAAGAPPLSSLAPFERIDADPQNAYPLTEENGPWLIMVTTLQGPKAEANAKALAYEMRKTYKLHAYTHCMKFDYSSGFNGKGIDRFGRQQKMKFSQGGKTAEVAVLVGDFNSVDDPQIMEILQRIKTLHPKSLAAEREGSGKTFDELREEALPANSARKKQGPLRLAFVTTNPLLPESYYQPKGVDQFIVKMNKGVEYSLLDNPARYTLRVATFSGNVVIDPKQMLEITEQGGKMKSRLMAAAEKAHETAIFLRAKGYEAYEYHDRHSSIVTVGGYESMGRQDAAGRLIYSPEIQQKIARFSAKRHKNKDGSLGPYLPEKIGTLKLYLDAEPSVIEVPRRSYGSDYARSMTGGQ